MKKTLSERLRAHLDKTAKFQPVPFTKEMFADKDAVQDLLDETIWENPRREIAWRWIETQYGLRLAFKLRGMNHIEYVAHSRDVAKEKLSNPTIQLFKLTRDTVRGNVTLPAGSHYLFVIGSGDIAEVTEAIEADADESVTEKLGRAAIPSNGVEA